jgi:hypothetical protein
MPDGPGKAKNVPEFELKFPARHTPREELLEDLRRVARKLRRDTVTIDQYNRHGRFHASTLQRRFRSWPKVLELAGLARSRSPIGIGDEELFANLRDVWERLGRQPRYVEVRAPLSRYSAGTYENRFGSWRKSLECFVTWANADVESEGDSKQDNPECDACADNAVSEVETSPRGISLRLRFRVLQRDNFRCVICGRSPAAEAHVVLHVDHIRPWSKGGPTDIGNLQTLCSKCNLGKGALDQ